MDNIERKQFHNTNRQGNSGCLNLDYYVERDRHKKDVQFYKQKSNTK